MDHYSEKRDWEFPKALLQRIHVLCLDVSDWTAKKH